MSIPSYNHFVNSPGFDRYQHTNSYFDYYSPGVNYGNITVSKKGSYVIENDIVLTQQLSEMFNREVPEILYNGEYISKGVININKQHMYEYVHLYNKNLPIPEPKDANRYVGDIGVINYIVWKMYHNLAVSTNGGGKILAYRFRFIFPPICAMYDVKSILTAIYKDLRDHIICYSYYFNHFGPDGIDFIVSNATFHGFKKGKRKKSTLSSYMNYTTERINDDLVYTACYNAVGKAKDDQ